MTTDILEQVCLHTFKKINYINFGILLNKTRIAFFSEPLANDYFLSCAAHVRRAYPYQLFGLSKSIAKYIVKLQIKAHFLGNIAKIVL